MSGAEKAVGPLPMCMRGLAQWAAGPLSSDAQECPSHDSDSESRVPSQKNGC